MVTDISTNNQNDLVAVCDINGEAESAVGAKLITVIEKFQRSLGEQKIRKKTVKVAELSRDLAGTVHGIKRSKPIRV